MDGRLVFGRDAFRPRGLRGCDCAVLRFARLNFLLNWRRWWRTARWGGPARFMSARFKTPLMTRRTHVMIGRWSIPEALASPLSRLWSIALYGRLLPRRFLASPSFSALQMMQKG